MPEEILHEPQRAKAPCPSPEPLGTLVLGPTLPLPGVELGGAEGAEPGEPTGVVAPGVEAGGLDGASPPDAEEPVDSEPLPCPGEPGSPTPEGRPCSPLWPFEAPLACSLPWPLLLGWLDEEVVACSVPRPLPGFAPAQNCATVSFAAFAAASRLEKATDPRRPLPEAVVVEVALTVPPVVEPLVALLEDPPVVVASEVDEPPVAFELEPALALPCAAKYAVHSP
jgi:hypothetical protein